MRKQWNIQSMYNEMIKDLKKCKTPFEKAMCKSICEKEIIENAIKQGKSGKLSPISLGIVKKINPSFRSRL